MSGNCGFFMTGRRMCAEYHELKVSVCENDENEGNEARVHELLHECIDCAYLEL